MGSFPNLGIRHVTKKSVSKILTDRLRETLKADKMMEGELGQDADQITLTGLLQLYCFFGDIFVLISHWEGVLGELNPLIVSRA